MVFPPNEQFVVSERMVFSITCLLSWLVLTVVTMMNECRTNLLACNLEICSPTLMPHWMMAPEEQRWTRSDYAPERRSFSC